MSGIRQELQEALCSYTNDTLNDIETVRGFCERNSTWREVRRTELMKLRDIIDRANNIEVNFSHVTHSKKKLKAGWEYLENTVTDRIRVSKYEELEQELAGVLKFTRRGLEELDHFLDAVEKLAVTSDHMFRDMNQVLCLPEEISLEHIEVIITAVREICPLLLEFKRDADNFFRPKLQNVKLLSYQLDRYTETAREMCDKLEKSRCLQMTTKHLADLGVNLPEDDSDRVLSAFNQHFELRLLFQRRNTGTEVNLDEDLPEEDVQQMLSHIRQLNEIRMDQHFRTVYLFKKFSRPGFTEEFSGHQLKMQEVLADLKKGATCLDCMNMVAKIFSIIGSLLGAVGGVVSIAGFASVGVSWTTGGAWTGITSFLIIALTFIIESSVNCCQKKKADAHFESFMGNVQEVTNQPLTNTEECKTDNVVGVSKVLGKVRGVVKVIDLLIDSLTVRETTIKEILGFVVTNGFSVIVDIICFIKDVYSLVKYKTEVSKFITARAELWESEMRSWQNIHDSLCEGQRTSAEYCADLDRPFYPEREI